MNWNDEIYAMMSFSEIMRALYRYFYFQVKAADNRIIQEQLNQKVRKPLDPNYIWNFICFISHVIAQVLFWFHVTFFQICECEELQETVASLKQQLSNALELRTFSPVVSYSQRFSETKSSHGELGSDKGNAILNDPSEGLLQQAQVSLSSPCVVLP